MAAHQVDLPWWCDAGNFFDEFLNYLRSSKSFAANRVECAGVAHRRWVFAVLDPARPEVSRVQFGVASSLPATQAYAWAWEEWLPEAARLLSGFVTEWSARAGGWRLVRMQRRLCPTTGQTHFECLEEGGLAFTQAPGADDSECGCWSLYYSNDAGDQPWWCMERRKLFFFPHAC